MITEFQLPELGENIVSGIIVRIAVSVGSAVARNQTVLEIETEKAVIDVPSPAAGTVTAIHVKEGDTLQIGQPMLSMETGDGPKADIPSKDELKPTEPINAGVTPSALVMPAQPAITNDIPPASPLVRRLARELGVDANEIPGTGPQGRITIEDVKHHVRQIIGAAGIIKAGDQNTAAPAVDFSRWGAIEMVAMSPTRRKTAEHMSQAWTIPHVTQFDRADITDLELLRKRHCETRGLRITTTVLLMKVIAAALKQFPQVNASIDLANQRIIHKKYYHLGIAVDTNDGLIVPVIRNVDQKNIFELTAELSAAADRARNRKTDLQEMHGGTFTISNLGGIGGTQFTPIIHAPEVAILGVARATMEPVFANDRFEPRLMLPLCLSYDHRVIDGADAARFLAWAVKALQKPFMLALENGDSP